MEVGVNSLESLIFCIVFTANDTLHISISLDAHTIYNKAYSFNPFIYKICKPFMRNTGQKVPINICFYLYVFSCTSDSVFAISINIISSFIIPSQLQP